MRNAKRVQVALTRVGCVVALLAIVLLTTRTASPVSTSTATTAITPVAAMAMAAANAISGGGVLFVDDDAPATGDGLTWDTAYRFLQDALAFAADAANGITEIRVGQGVYKPDRDEANPEGTGDREATFELSSDLTLAGGYAGIGADDRDERDIELYPTTLSGDLNGDDRDGFVNNEENSLHVVSVLFLVALTALDGVTITSGRADVPNDDAIGGGILIESAELELNNCTVTANFALHSGGGLRALEADLSITGGSFSSNESEGVGGLSLVLGSFDAVGVVFEANVSSDSIAAVNISNGPATIASCVFRDNSGIDNGALRLNTSGPDAFYVVDCEFTNNMSVTAGGAMCCDGLGSLSLTDTTFSGNFAENEAGALLLDIAVAEVDNCQFISNVVEDLGGAVSIRVDTTATFTSCLFLNNEARDGGGVYSDRATAATYIGCTFEQNHAANSGGGAYDHSQSFEYRDCLFLSNSGGNDAAAYLEPHLAGMGLFVDCQVIANSALDDVGGILLRGNIVVSDCHFTLNEAFDEGGALAVIAGPALVANCRFDLNSANQEGGAVFAADPDFAFVSCLFNGNFARRGGAVALNPHSNNQFINCTITNNDAGLITGGIYAFGEQGGQHASIINCILWNNTDNSGNTEHAQLSVEVPGTLIVDYSCIDGWTGGLGGAGNHGQDPLFADIDGADNEPGTPDDDLQLTTGSPCVDAANNGLVETCGFDLNGATRATDDPETRDTGFGESPIVDMGAYELLAEFGVDCNENFLVDACEISEGTQFDCNLNGVPDECDIADGTSADDNNDGVPDECEEDCNGNGIADVVDIVNGTSEDCNGNAIPDECDILQPFVAESGPLSPIGFDSPQSFEIESPPEAIRDVAFHFEAVADLAARIEFLDVEVNDVFLGSVFVDGASDCPREPDIDELIVGPDAFNDIVAGGSAMIFLTAPGSVNAAACDGASFVIVRVEISLGGVSDDLNNNGIPDECETPGDLDGDGVVGPSDLILLLGVWGRCADCDQCVADLDGDCTVGPTDLIILLGNWG